MQGDRSMKQVGGAAGILLLAVVTAFWTFWSVAEMFHEGWWGAWTNRAAYLIPGAVCLLLSLLVLRWPRLGGWLLVLVGAGFSAWWWLPAALRGTLTWRRVLGQFPVSASLVLIGGLLLLDAGVRRASSEPKARSQSWWRRSWRTVLLVGLPLAVGVSAALANLPRILTRIDDGRRDARLVQGNGVELIWAPLGPGWNWRQPAGWYPGWQDIALYGVLPFGARENLPPVEETRSLMEAGGLCAYLDESGASLLGKPLYLWRMPTVDELVRSLVHHGENAGCSWDGEVGRVTCRLSPDKETPLWAPDLAPIYYWAAELMGDGKAYFVSYNGWVDFAPITAANSRHGYRCVKEPGLPSP